MGAQEGGRTWYQRRVSVFRSHSTSCRPPGRRRHAGLPGTLGTREGRLQIESGSCRRALEAVLPAGGQGSSQSAGPRLLEVFSLGTNEDGSGAATRPPPEGFSLRIPFLFFMASISLFWRPGGLPDNFLSCRVCSSSSSASLSVASVTTTLMPVQELCIYSVWQHAATTGRQLLPSSPCSSAWL